MIYFLLNQHRLWEGFKKYSNAFPFVKLLWSISVLKTKARSRIFILEFFSIQQRFVPSLNLFYQRGKTSHLVVFIFYEESIIIQQYIIEYMIESHSLVWFHKKSINVYLFGLNLHRMIKYHISWIFLLLLLKVDCVWGNGKKLLFRL